ncbi:MAG: hypothetical protein DI598_05425 [Pseudopedobacter saltans]|uniref:Uncharacterized protein n=1 Tax=Pseudopedobacter saltans TaxID=151895 RepID=A0A2W5H4J3_9SPHI|nr:MAG: hypothetical protein DI598_05425 [Pseudopedobacter saltans]
MNNTFKLRDNIFSSAYSLSFLEDDLEIKYPFKEYLIKYSDIDKLRCGIKWIKGYMFSIGRTFVIDFTLKDGSQFSLKLLSLYKIKLSSQQENYKQIITILFEKTFDKKIAQYVDLIENGNSITIEKLKLSLKGIFIIDNNTPSQWHSVSLKKYFHYFVIYDIINPKINVSFDYLRDWDSWIIYSICEKFIQKNIRS